jgi:hypothetical protein
LTVTATSSNPGLIPNPVVSYTSSKTNGTLSFRPATNSYGATTITVNVNDGGASNNLTAQSFVVSVGLAQMKIATQKPFMLTVTGQIGHVYTIQATQDFKTWTNIGSVTRRLDQFYRHQRGELFAAFLPHARLIPLERLTRI